MSCLPSLPSNNLIDPLLRDTEGSSDASACFTRFVPLNDFGVTLSLFGHQIILGFGRIWAVIQHLNDVESSQPNVEASCGFEPPTGLVPALSNGFEEWMGKRS